MEINIISDVASIHQAVLLKVLFSVLNSQLESSDLFEALLEVLIPKSEAESKVTERRMKSL